MSKKVVVFYFSLILFLSTSFTSDIQHYYDSGEFSCIINDKPFIIHGLHAEMRTVTGGFKQLSLSNDLFTSFFFINPSTKEIELSAAKKREAVVRYTNPTNLSLYYPEKGIVKIEKLDEAAKLLSGQFEMELITKDQAGKRIKITNGKLINIPIIYK
jgi:hypothetical protein